MEVSRVRYPLMIVVKLFPPLIFDCFLKSRTAAHVMRTFVRRLLGIRIPSPITFTTKIMDEWPQAACGQIHGRHCNGQADVLLALRPRLRRIGGSNAQRDL